MPFRTVLIYAKYEVNVNIPFGVPPLTQIPATGKGSSSGVKVSRVIRIHNRFLKNRFDRCIREVNAASASASATPYAAASGRPAATATVTSPSGATEGKATTSQQQQQQDGTCGGCSPTRLPRTHTGAAEPCSAGSGLNDENKPQLEEEGSGSSVTHVGGEGDHLGPSLSTSGAVWRSTHRSGSPQDIGSTGSGRSGPTSESASRRDAAERAAAVDRSGTTSATGGSGSNSKSRATDGERRKGDKRSSSPSPRSLEYLFFTGRRGGTGGIERGPGRREPSGGGGFWGNTTWRTASAGDSNAYESWQPDLLKLAEDGFRLPDWGEAETEIDAEGSVNLAEPSAPGAGGVSSHPSAYSTSSAGEDTTAAVGTNPPDRGCREEAREPPRPQSIVLSTHLSKTDIPGMSGDAALTAAAQASKVNSSGVAPPASIGLGNSEFVSPVCRVLVVKVYTGRTYRLPCGSPSGGGSHVGAGWGTGSRGSNVGRVPRSSVLKEAWATGFKAVCVSEDDEVREGGERGDGDGEGGYCLKKTSSRHQVRFGVAPRTLHKHRSMTGCTSSKFHGTMAPPELLTQRVAPWSPA